MKVILISGKAQNGKDTAANIMKKRFEKDGKSVVVAHYGDLVKFVCEKYFNWNGEKDERGRTLLQYVGTDAIRAKDKNYWVRFVSDMLCFFQDIWDYALIPDCRFPNEISVIKDAIGDAIHVRVRREDFVSPLTEKQQKHPSETSLDNVLPDYYIINDSTIEEFTEKVNRFIEENIYEKES